MENYAEVLDYLIELKKTKKEPNKLERDQFTEAWKALLHNDGYSAAEKYLYNGFTYCGASPLKTYIKECDNSLNALQAVFSGKLYGKNCANTVPILFHLLALFLNDKNRDLNIIAALIQRIPSALKNQDGKLYGQADRALKKYVLDELHCDVLPEFADLIDSGLSLISAKQFISSIDQIISGMKSEGYSKKSIANIKMLQAWMHPSVKKAVSDPVVITEKQQEIAVEEKKVHEENERQPEESENSKNDESLLQTLLPDVNTATANNAENAAAECNHAGENHSNDTNTPCISEADSELEKTRSELSVTRKKLEESGRIRKEQSETIVTQRAKLDYLENQMATLQKALSEKDSRLIMLSSNNEIMQKKVKDLENVLAIKEQELSARTQMMEVLSRDRARQSDEALNRLASKLRVEYRDFKDAIDLPMDSNLGENMREQLKNIFNILIKAGISINN